MTDYLAALIELDDADLDPFQRALMTHYLRRGLCWESVRVTAKVCKMSPGKVSTTRKWLLDSGWIEWRPTNQGKMAIKICLQSEQPQPNRRLPDKQRLPRKQDDAPDKQSHTPHERHLKKDKLSKEKEVREKKKEEEAPPPPVHGGFAYEHDIDSIAQPNSNGAILELEVTPVDAMATAIVSVCVMDLRLKFDDIDSMAKLLVNGGYTVEQLHKYYDKGGWWYTDHWQGIKNGKPPTINWIKDTFRLAIAEGNGSRPKPSQSSNGNGRYEIPAPALPGLTDKGF